ncbi:MAG: HAD family hydrolase, partial [Alphaproteobacteria bacterium]|nr:HAD family hydrolase [Alphaproteobacteria bacterium]
MANLIVFDCDGVLVDSEILACRIGAAELTRHGFPHRAAEVVERYCGVAESTMSEMVARDWGRPLPEDFWPGFRARLEVALRAELTPMAHAAEVIATLTPAACVASSSRPERIRLSLELTGLHDLLAPHLFSATMVADGKPAPDLCLLAAARMGVDPADCLVIEDSVAGIRAAVSADMRPIGFVGGGHATPALAE